MSLLQRNLVFNIVVHDPWKENFDAVRQVKSRELNILGDADT